MKKETKKKRIAIIGHFGGNENILDGQTIKTKILYDELKKVTDWNIRKVDTYYKSKKPIKLLLESIIALFSTRDVIVLLSGNGMKFYFPLLNFFARVFGTRVYHDVIGGNLDTYVQKYPKFKSYLNSFKANWVETELLKRKLEENGVYNCEVVPNFKRLDIAETRSEKYEEPYRFCIFSRVMKEKGVEDAIDAIQRINAEEGREVCKLDIYGRIDESYKEHFESLMNKATTAVRYMGMIPYDESVKAISGYYALLFPTYWMGEGFPGTIIDAFSAGLPVIATDWNCNSEIIEHKKNGILYPNIEMDDLTDAVKWLIRHNLEVDKLKNYCLETAKNYQPEKYIQIIINEISNDKK